MPLGVRHGWDRPYGVHAEGPFDALCWVAGCPLHDRYVFAHITCCSFSVR